MYIYKYIYIYICIYVYEYVYICVYIYIYIRKFYVSNQEKHYISRIHQHRDLNLLSVSVDSTNVLGPLP